ncbi:MAG: hypothetical protein L0241_14850 [Planctomycetia bacterium]|nr:hypothetical protein [Planctomycetia bacterium]
MPDASRYSRWLVSGVFLLLIGATLFAIWYFTRSPPPTPIEEEALVPDPAPPDPRLVFDTPFRNVKPEVRYVGDEACAKCHQSVTQSYHAHPMGRSAAFVSKGMTVEKYHPSGRTVFSAGSFDLEVERSPEGARHRIRLREPAPVAVPEVVLPVEIAIGSGTRGRSYLSVEHGSVWQAPVSWYGPEAKWDLSPGFRLGHTVRRAIQPACLYCHVDRVEPIPGAENRYRQPLFPKQAAIGCERCHGPGELHVAERNAGARPQGMDTSIVNPLHLTPELQLAICEQCHLQGEERVNRRGRDLFEFRPGLPFEQFVSVYVRHPDIASVNKSVGQFEQMEQSRCFTQSGRRMVCTSCHDPHKVPSPEEKDAHYRQRCLNCHNKPTARKCSLPEPDRQAKNDSCFTCHMPRAASSNIIHTSITDHRVLRKPGPAPVARGLPFGTSPLIRFRSGPFTPPQDELDRDLGIALARFGKKGVKELADRSDIRVLASERLTGSLAIWKGDADAWSALANTRAERGQAAEKFKAATNAVTLAPTSEPALIALIEAATASGEFDLAESTAGKLIQNNPHASQPLVIRAFVYLSRGEWAKAEADCIVALRIHPLHPEARVYLAICLYKKGDSITALREAQTATRLESDPRQKAFLMDFYRRFTRP